MSASGVVHTVVGTAANEAYIIRWRGAARGRKLSLRCRLYRAEKRPEHGRPRGVVEHRDQRGFIKALPKVVRDLAERWSGRCHRCAPGSSTPSTSSETVRHKKLRYRGLAKEYRAVTYLVCPGQPGDRQEALLAKRGPDHPSRTRTGRSTPGTVIKSVRPTNRTAAEIVPAGKPPAGSSFVQCFLSAPFAYLEQDGLLLLHRAHVAMTLLLIAAGSVWQAMNAAGWVGGLL